jgi:diguanylate cyclase (GGDEF)-like protein
MRALETHIFGHGYAYLFHGDEYALLMPNTDAGLAMDFVQRLRERVETLVFHGTEKTITVSAGVCVADRDCHLTDEELLQKAEQAMNFAKKEGRDRVAGYGGKLFDESELQVLLPAGASGT